MLISALEKNKVEQGVGNVLNGFTMFIYLFRNYFKLTEKNKNTTRNYCCCKPFQSKWLSLLTTLLQTKMFCYTTIIQPSESGY